MWQLSLFCYFQPKEQTLSIKGKDLGHLDLPNQAVQCQCHQGLFHVSPFCILPSLLLTQPDRIPCPNPKPGCFSLKWCLVINLSAHLACTTCLLSQFLQSISKLKLSLYLCPQLLHFSPAFCILSSGYQITIKQ